MRVTKCNMEIRQTKSVQVRRVKSKSNFFFDVPLGGRALLAYLCINDSTTAPLQKALRRKLCFIISFEKFFFCWIEKCALSSIIFSFIGISPQKFLFALAECSQKSLGAKSIRVDGNKNCFESIRRVSKFIGAEFDCIL